MATSGGTKTDDNYNYKKKNTIQRKLSGDDDDAHADSIFVVYRPCLIMHLFDIHLFPPRKQNLIWPQNLFKGSDP